jgi:hypothetical protein
MAGMKKIKIVTSKPVVVSITPSLLFFFIILIGAVVAVFYYLNNQTGAATASASNHTTASYVKNVYKSGDDRYAMAPEAARSWVAPPDIRGAFIPPGAIPINVATKSIPESYRQMGVINADGKLLPLYGRRNGRGTDIYNYYTRTDTYNPVQIPISAGRRDCTEDIGCKELSDGDTVKIYGVGEGHVKLYNIDAPRYIPGLV